jgi:thiol:disulfide interchange protein DsbD
MNKYFQRLFVVLVLLVFVKFSVAQVLQPVTWKTEIKMVSETEADLIFTATIQDHWHLYAQWLPEGNFLCPHILILTA